MNNPTDLKWLAVDFDGTIASKEPDFSIGQPIEENIIKLRECADMGYEIVIHTARHWEDYSALEKWLNKHDIPFKSIVCGKILAYRYIDDRAIQADADWKEHL